MPTVPDLLPELRQWRLPATRETKYYSKGALCTSMLNAKLKSSSSLTVSRRSAPQLCWQGTSAMWCVLASCGGWWVGGGWWCGGGWWVVVVGGGWWVVVVGGGPMQCGRPRAMWPLCNVAAPCNAAAPVQCGRPRAMWPSCAICSGHDSLTCPRLWAAKLVCLRKRRPANSLA